MTTPHLTLAPGLIPVVQLGVGDVRAGTNEAKWGSGRWDQAGSRWAGAEPYWLDVSCHVISLESRSGRDRTVSRWDAGTATFVLENGDGWADVLVDPATPANLQLRPGRALRWGIDAGAGPVWVWRGFVDAHTATYSGRVAAADTVTLQAVDAFGEVGRATLPGLAAPVGANETPTVRIGRILDAVGWRPEWRALDASGLALLDTTLDGQVADLLGQVADTAGGSVFGDPAGRIVFRNRDWQMYAPGRVPDAVVGNTAAADTCPQSVTLDFNRDGMTTRAVVDYTGNTAGVPVVVDDTAAQTLYGIETGPTLTDLLVSTTAHLTTLANRLVATQGVGVQPRVTGVSLDAAHDGAAAVMLRTSPFTPSLWRVTLERAGRAVLTRDMLVTAVDHHLDAVSWTLNVSLDDARPWQAASGRWDGAAGWDRVTWAAALAELESALLLASEAAHV